MNDEPTASEIRQRSEQRHAESQQRLMGLLSARQQYANDLQGQYDAEMAKQEAELADIEHQKKLNIGGDIMSGFSTGMASGSIYGGLIGAGVGALTGGVEAYGERRKMGQGGLEAFGKVAGDIAFVGGQGQTLHQAKTGKLYGGRAMAPNGTMSALSGLAPALGAASMATRAAGPAKGATPAAPGARTDIDHQDYTGMSDAAAIADNEQMQRDWAARAGTQYDPSNLDRFK